VSSMLCAHTQTEGEGAG